MFERFSTRQIAVVAGLLIALVTTVITGLGSAAAINRINTARAQNQFAVLSHKLVDDIRRFIRSQEETVSVVASHIGAMDGLPVAEISSLLDRVTAGHTEIDVMYATDRSLRSIAASPPTRSDGRSALGIDYSDRSFIQEALKTKRPVISNDVIIHKTNNIAIVAIAAPIIDATGDIKGLVVAGIFAEHIQNTAALIKFGESGHARVATGSGKILANPAKEGAKALTDYSRLSIWSHLSSTASGIVPLYTNQFGEQRTAGFDTVPGVGWKVWVSQSSSEIEQEAAKSLLELTLWAAVAALVAVAFTFWLAKQLSRPMEDLRVAADKVGAGNLEYRATERGPRDLVMLTRALNGMAGSLQTMVKREQDAKARLGATIKEYGTVTSAVADGDLTVRVAATEEPALAELGDGLNRMIESLGQIVTEIQGAAESLVSAGNEILSATSQQVSATAQELTAVKETAATIAEVRQTAELSAQRARAVADASQRMVKVAQDGRSAVEESIRGSEDAKTRIEALADQILGFSEQVQEIAEINATVNELAEQSNLLAVNAAIEAARAGEAGRGFAVVAGEVKALAEQCKRATAQVRSLLAEIQRATQTAVVTAEQVVRTAEGGLATATRSGESIRMLADAVKEATQVAQQIVASVQQQTVGMDQITLAMRNIEQASGQTLAGTTQVQRAAQDLTALARKLESLTTRTQTDARRTRHPRHA